MCPICLTFFQSALDTERWNKIDCRKPLHSLRRIAHLGSPCPKSESTRLNQTEKLFTVFDSTMYQIEARKGQFSSTQKLICKGMKWKVRVDSSRFLVDSISIFTLYISRPWFQFYPQTKHNNNNGPNWISEITVSLSPGRRLKQCQKHAHGRLSSRRSHGSLCRGSWIRDYTHASSLCRHCVAMAEGGRKACLVEGMRWIQPYWILNQVKPGENRKMMTYRNADYDKAVKPYMNWEELSNGWFFY